MVLHSQCIHFRLLAQQLWFPFMWKLKLNLGKGQTCHPMPGKKPGENRRRRHLPRCLRNVLGRLLLLLGCSVVSDWDPTDCSPPASSVRGILQARILVCVAISFSRGSPWPRDRTCVSRIAGGFFTAKPPGKHHYEGYLPRKWGFPGGSDGKESACNAGNLFLIPGSGRATGEGNGYSLQCSCWRIPWTEERGRLPPMGLQRIDMTEWLTLIYKVEGTKT